VSHRDLLAEFLPDDLRSLLVDLRRLHENPRASVELNSSSVLEPRCEAALRALKEAREGENSRAAQMKQRQLVEAALLKVAEVALELAPRDSAQLQAELPAVPGLHLLATVRRNHQRSLEALRLAVD
jgi:hypothetical protein